MKFSIIIPIYNADKYLKEALQSVINQTYSDWELLCVNDGSTDGSAEILGKFSENDSRVKVVHQINSGQGIARNRGIELAAGDYVLFLDADDWLENDALETVKSVIKNDKTDIVIFEKDEYFEDTHRFARRSILRISQAASKVKLLTVRPFALIPNEIYTPKELSLTFFYTIPYTWDKAYHREFLLENNLRYDEGKLSEDTGFYLDSLLSAKNIIYTDKYLYHYRNHSANITKTAGEKNFSVFFRIERVKSLLAKHAVQKQLNANYQYFALWCCCTSFKGVPKNQRLKFLCSAFKVLKLKYFLFFIYFILT